MRKFTKYPSNYVKASVSEGQLVQVKPYSEIKNAGWCVPDMAKFCGRTYEVSHIDVGTQPGFVYLDIPYGEYVSPNLPDPEGWQFREDGLIPVDNSIEASTSIKASSYEGRPHWHAIAEFSDGTTLEFDRAYNADGNYSLENEEQYGIESELLTKATDTGKEVTFYSVDFVDDSDIGIDASTDIKADTEFNADYDQAIEDFMVALEKLPEIRKNPYQTPIHITNTEATIIANPNFEDIDAYIEKVESLGKKFSVLKPNTGHYDRQTHTIRFELSKPLNY